MKVLLIGHYRERSGWGEITRRYIECLSKVVDLVIRPSIIENNAELTQDILDLEEKSQVGCTHCIQFVLPHLMTYDSRLKNIGIFMWETYNIPNIWKEYLDFPDKIWVTNNEMKKACTVDGYKNDVIPIPIPDDYHSETLPDKRLENSYNFYFVGEVNARKNIESLVRCFHSTFSREEDVNLILKLNKPGHTSEQVVQLASADIKNIKRGLRLYKDELYKEDFIISDYLPRKKMVQLHNTCDCFVSCSHGEGISLSMIDAIACGNPVIVPEDTGEGAIVKSLAMEKIYAGKTITGELGPCYKWDTIPGYANAYDRWVNIDESKMMARMREMFEKGKVKLNHSLENYNYELVGQNLLEKLCKM